MTDKLKETVEHAIQELKEVVATLNSRRVWRGTCWEYPPILPDQYLKLRNTIHWQVSYLRSALAEWTPDATKMIDKDFALNVAIEALHNFADDESVDGWKAIDAIGVVRKALSEPPVKSYCGGKPNYCEPEMPIDRGAWSDVPNATKWVDELRGDEPEPVSWALKMLMDDKETVYRIYDDERHCLLDADTHGGVCVPLYEAQPPNTTRDVVEPVAWIGQRKDGGVELTDTEPTESVRREFNMRPLYAAPPKREWQWLTEEDIHDLFMANETVDDYGELESIACTVSAKLKEKNHD